MSASLASRLALRASTVGVPHSKLGPASPRLLRSLFLVALAAPLSACDWFTDFKDQPKIEPWESVADSVPPRANPQSSVPVQGSFAPGFLVSQQPLPATIDSMSGVANPVPADARSLENGRKLFQINCAVCHGANGIGVGPAVRYGMVGIGLVTDNARTLSDGYIWGIIRNGRGLMPSYNRIEELERWDVVNYVRGLQGRYPVDTTMALPGVTGDALPGPTPRAPTQPAPFFNPVRGTAVGPAPTSGQLGGQAQGGTSPADTSNTPGARRP